MERSFLGIPGFWNADKPGTAKKAGKIVFLLAAMFLLLANHSAFAEGDHDERVKENLSKGYKHGHGFQFALIGDVPYAEEDFWKFDNVIEEINDSNIKWVLHAGDIKTGSSLCSDELILNRFDTYQQFEKPFIYTPGDNEWTDCHREKAGMYAPLERLAKLREIFFPEPGYTTGGKEMRVTTQAEDPDYAEFVENVYWRKGNVMFATMHIVGSENATREFPGRTAVDDEEVVRRTNASIAWMRTVFDVAEKRNSPGVFLLIQANPHFEAEAGSEDRKGFNEFLDALEREVIKYGKPVLFAHGDSHYFRYDKPLTSQISGRRIENFTRLETFGSRDVHWVKVTVQPGDPEVFHVRQEIVESNLEDHPLP